MRGGCEPTHLSLALPRWLVRHFRPIVCVLPGAVHRRRHHGAVGGSVAPQLVRDQTARLTALPLQQFAEKAPGRTPISSGLDEDVDDVAVLVDGPPQILPSALNSHEEFVEIPRVAQTAMVAAKPPRVVEPERLTPLPNRFIGHGDTQVVIPDVTGATIGWVGRCPLSSKERRPN